MPSLLSKVHSTALEELMNELVEAADLLNSSYPRQRQRAVLRMAQIDALQEVLDADSPNTGAPVIGHDIDCGFHEIGRCTCGCGEEDSPTRDNVVLYSDRQVLEAVREQHAACADQLQWCEAKRLLKLADEVLDGARPSPSYGLELTSDEVDELHQWLDYELRRMLDGAKITASLTLTEEERAQLEGYLHSNKEWVKESPSVATWWSIAEKVLEAAR